MPFRSDISVDWSVSPRIITVAAPSTELSVQDLVDTCRELEQQVQNLTYPHLLDASGKESLGAGVSVGITVELQNAVIAFEPRLASLVSGIASSSDPNGQILEDSGATFISSGVVAGDSITNVTDGSVSSIREVISETELRTYALQDGFDNQWSATDTYKIWSKVQCEVSGGNLVAVDAFKSEISSFLPTKNTHVVRTSSSSATLQELDAIQYASYGGGVHLDVLSGKTGTAYPCGTEEFPVNNLADAALIAAEKGFGRFYVRGNLNITNENVAGYVFIGQSVTLSNINIDPAANVANCEFNNATVTGTLDGGNTLYNCVADGITYVNGRLNQCGLLGTITLGGGAEASFVWCYSGSSSAVNYPVINLGGSGQSLLVRNFSGGLGLENKTGTDDVSVDFATGFLNIDSSVISGPLYIRGLVSVTDNSSASVTVDTSGVLFTDQVQLSAFNNAVTVDVGGGTPGTKFPQGTRQHPVNNLADAKSILATRGLDTIYIKDTLVVGATDDISGIIFQGTGSLGNGVVLTAGCNTAEATFYDLDITGTFNGRFNALRCNVRNVYNIGDPAGISCFYESRFVETPTIEISSSANPGDTGSVHFINCTSGVEKGDIVLDLASSNYRVAIRNFAGHLTVKNHSSVKPIEMSFAQGKVTFDSTCIAGSCSVRGICEIVDNSTGTFSLDRRAHVSLSNLTPAAIGSLEELITGNVDGLNYREVASALLAVLAGKMVVTNNGPKDDTVEFKSQDDVTTYVTGRVVNGIRTESDVNEENM